VYLGDANLAALKTKLIHQMEVAFLYLATDYDKWRLIGGERFKLRTMKCNKI